MSDTQLGDNVFESMKYKTVELTYSGARGTIAVSHELERGIAYTITNNEGRVESCLFDVDSVIGQDEDVRLLAMAKAVTGRSDFVVAREIYAVFCMVRKLADTVLDCCRFEELEDGQSFALLRPDAAYVRFVKREGVGHNCFAPGLPGDVKYAMVPDGVFVRRLRKMATYTDASPARLRALMNAVTRAGAQLGTNKSKFWRDASIDALAAGRVKFDVDAPENRLTDEERDHLAAAVKALGDGTEKLVMDFSKVRPVGDQINGDETREQWASLVEEVVHKLAPPTEPVPAAPKWRPSPAGGDGYYWWRHRSWSDPMIVGLRGDMFYRVGSVTPLHIDDDPGEWCGPIESPR